MTMLKKFELPLFFLLFATIIWWMQPTGSDTKYFAGDGMRYIDYAVSVYEHGIFGLGSRHEDQVPEPGNANAPLYPVFVAGMMALDDDLATSLTCVLRKTTEAACPEQLDRFFMVQTGIALLFLYIIYQTAFQWSHKRLIGWGAAGLVVASGMFTDFPFVFMTEILILPAFAALGFFCLLFYQKRQIRYIFFSALMLAILTLIRPSYLYLFYGFVVFFTASALFKPGKKTLLGVLVLILTFVMTISPWALRNKVQFDSYTLTSGGYAEAILIQRVNYNQMSWAEVGVAFLYWMPDFGDNLAKKIFPDHLHNKLGWSEDSYYGQGYHTRYAELAKELGGEDKILPYLIREEILSLKHIAVSIPLALRGLFVYKYWGLVGLIAFLALLTQTLRRDDYSVLIMSLPLLFMVAFHAGLSVSIYRYNVPLVVLYALSMAWYAWLFGARIYKKGLPCTTN